jgi:hypothetical protein
VYNNSPKNQRKIPILFIGTDLIRHKGAKAQRNNQSALVKTTVDKLSIENNQFYPP